MKCFPFNICCLGCSTIVLSFKSFGMEVFEFALICIAEQTLAAFDRLAMPASAYNDLSMGPYYQVRFLRKISFDKNKSLPTELFQMHPQDELSRIKMRNRRFVNACAQVRICSPKVLWCRWLSLFLLQENSLANVHMFEGAPFARGGQMGFSVAPSATLDYEMANDELSVSYFTFPFSGLDSKIQTCIPIRWIRSWSRTIINPLAGL